MGFHDAPFNSGWNARSRGSSTRVAARNAELAIDLCLLLTCRMKWPNCKEWSDHTGAVIVYQ
jgi:hypothetical protein